MIRVDMMAIIYKKNGMCEEDSKQSKMACTATKTTLKTIGVKMKNACVSEHLKNVYGLVFWCEPKDMPKIYEISTSNGVTNIVFRYSDVDED